MEKVSVDDVDPGAVGGTVDQRRLADPLGTTDVAINRYRLEPGQRLAGLHAHEDQEEVFVVLEGEATFETLDGEVAVGSGEAVRFAPGEFQAGKNASESEVVTLALGAPRDTEDVRIPLACSDCGNDELRLAFAEAGEDLVCPDCGAGTSAACAECGSENKRVVLGDDGETLVDRCLDCGVESPAR